MTVLDNIRSNLKSTTSSIQSEGLITHLKRRASGQAKSGLFMGLKNGIGKGAGSLSLGNVMGQLSQPGGAFVKNKLDYMGTKFASASAAATPLDRTKALLMPQLFQGKSSLGSFGDTMFGATSPKYPEELLRENGSFAAETAPASSLQVGYPKFLKR